MRPDPPIHGLIVIDKPQGWTSHDVVAKVRRLIGVRRVGHAGTLDPMATGVLPLGIGQGTRMLDYLGDADKGYEAEILLGVATDTYDAEGRVTRTADPSSVSIEMLRAGLAALTGEIEQRPPAYSAIKQNGVPLYKLARAGQEVVAPVRRVTVYRIDLLDVALPAIRVRVHCSKGTYIRSIAHDLGEALGCGAHLTALRRTAAGSFGLSDAITLETLAASVEDGSLPARLLPLDTVLLRERAAILGAEAERRLRDGVAPALPLGMANGTLCRAYTGEGRLLAVLRLDAAGGRWRPDKVFLQSA